MVPPLGPLLRFRSLCVACDNSFSVNDLGMRGRLLRYIAGRLVIVCLAAVALSWTVFLLVHALPGNPFSGSERMTDAREQLLIHRAHLDDPYPLQYLHWVDTYFNGGLSPVLLGEAWTSIRLGLFA